MKSLSILFFMGLLSINAQANSDVVVKETMAWVEKSSDSGLQLEGACRETALALAYQAAGSDHTAEIAEVRYTKHKLWKASKSIDSTYVIKIRNFDQAEGGWTNAISVEVGRLNRLNLCQIFKVEKLSTIQLQ